MTNIQKRGGSIKGENHRFGSCSACKRCRPPLGRAGHRTGGAGGPGEGNGRPAGRPRRAVMHKKNHSTPLKGRAGHRTGGAGGPGEGNGRPAGRPRRAVMRKKNHSTPLKRQAGIMSFWRRSIPHVQRVVLMMRLSSGSGPKQSGSPPPRSSGRSESVRSQGTRPLPRKRGRRPARTRGSARRSAGLSRS